MRRLIVVLAFLVLISATARAESAERVLRLETRPGVTLGALLLEGPQPRACVILLAGGAGNLRIAPDGSLGWGKGNFLVRTRALFAQQGFVVAVPDAPSDHSGEGLVGNFRVSAEHAQDIGVLAAYLKKAYGLPVWLVGTSMGTVSAANGAARLGPEQVAGIVLTSTVTHDEKHGPGVHGADLAAVRVPVLVLHHEGDDCPVSPLSGARSVQGDFPNVPRVEFVTVSGGAAGDKVDRCGGASHHGYLGIEDEVVGRIAGWIGR